MGNASGGSVKEGSQQRKAKDRHSQSSLKLIDGVPPPPWGPSDSIQELAPRKNALYEEEQGDEECPICFLNFVKLNSAVCCSQSICTDCYLLVKTGKMDTCPFCNHHILKVTYKTPEVVAVEEMIGGTKMGGFSLLETSSTCTTSTTTTSRPISAAYHPYNSPLPTRVVIMATVSDRKQLELDIQSSRQKYKEDLAPSSPPVRPTSMAINFDSVRFLPRRHIYACFVCGIHIYFLSLNETHLRMVHFSSYLSYLVSRVPLLPSFL